MGSYLQIQYCFNHPVFVPSSFLNEDRNFRTKPWSTTSRKQFKNKYWIGKKRCRGFVCEGIFDSWAPEINSPVIATQLSALSLLPYLGFLYFITKSKSAPRLTLFGFHFLLAFVGAAIAAGTYAKVHYATSLSNVDWLHGAAESLLMLTNLFIVLGLREALRKAHHVNRNTLTVTSGLKEKEKSSV